MSIASEFDSTIENIKSDYEGLENLGADLTNVNKNIQNIRTCLDNIYSSLPKTTGEGLNLSLTTLKGRINVDDILGDTEQDSTTGINLFIPSLKNIDDNTTITKSNAVSSLTLNDNEFTFVASGADVYFGQVASAGGNYSNANGNKINVGSATKISYRLTNTDFNRGHFTAYDSNNVSLGYTGIQGNTGTYTIPSGTSYVTFRFGKNNATSGTTYKTKVIVALGDTIPDYQDYTGGQASPNPTYPQDINVATGTQEVVVQNKNLLPITATTQTISGVTITINSDKTITLNGTSTSALGLDIGHCALVSGSYKGNCETNATTNTYYIRLGEGEGDSSTWIANATNNTTVTLSEDKNVYARLIIRNGVTLNNVKIYPMIYKGTTSTSYIEHQEQTKTLHLSSKNLFQTGFRQGGFGGKEANRIFSTSNAKIKSGVTYTLSTNLDTTKFRYACNIGTAPFPTTIENRVYDSGWKYSSSFTFTALTSGYFGLPVSKNDNSNLTPSDIEGVWWQLEEGSTATTYEPYYNYELGGIGTYKNRIFETSGKNLTDIVLNGSTTGEITYKTYTLQPNTQYTISTNTWVTSTSTANVFASSGTSFSPSSSSNGVNGSRTITSDNNGNITIGYRNVNMSMDYSSGKYWVMLNEGSTALPYEPYGSDKWYIEKNIGKVVLNGSETGWGTQNDVFCIEINDILTQSYDERSIIVLSNYFLGAITAYRGGINNLTIAKTIDKGKPKQLGIRYDAFNNVVADFKTWLSTHNTNVYYVLATPTYEEITNETLIEELNELEKMMSYNGQTNISVTGSLPMLLSVSALKGE